MTGRQAGTPFPLKRAGRLPGKMPPLASSRREAGQARWPHPLSRTKAPGSAGAQGTQHALLHARPHASLPVVLLKQMDIMFIDHT